MFKKNSSTVDYSQQEATSKFVSKPLILSSHQAGWKNINLAHYCLPEGEIPEIASLQHTIVLPFWQQPTKVEMISEGKLHTNEHDQNEINCIEILPAHVPISSKWNQEIEFVQCYLDHTFLSHIAYESVNPEQVEIALTIKKPDPLVWQIVLALKSVLETDANNSKFYAESMATALAAHFLKDYSIRKHVIREYEDGLPQYRLKQAIEYINEHFSENISIAEISSKLNISP